MSDKNRRDALTPGEQIHWYRIDRVLGQGGFGITYLAHDTNLEQPVAIKEFLPLELAVRVDDGTVQPRSVDEDDDYHLALDRFISEARTLAQFDHPNIVRVHSVFEANNTAYMVMRHERGENLHDRLARDRTMDEEQLMQLVRPVLNGLGQVHSVGFIHRDIQPANIHLREDGTPVLLDFGAARETLGRSRTLTITVAPGYAPFEQYYASGAQQGPWTDIYGLGATLYRAVAGVPPIDAIERSRGILGSTRDVLVPAATVGRGRYSPRFLDAIDHALKFDTRERPQSVGEWLADFEETANRPAGQPPDSGEPSRTKPELQSPLPQKEGLVAPKPRALSIVTLLIAVGMGGFATALVMWAVDQAAVSSSASLSSSAIHTIEIEKARRELDELRRNIAAENQLYERIRIRIETGEQQLADLQRRLQQSEQENEHSTSRLNTPIEEARTEEADLARLQNELQSLRQRRDTLEVDRKGLQAELGALRQQKMSLEQEIAALKQRAAPAPLNRPEPATAPDLVTPEPKDALLSGTAVYEAGDYAAAMTLLRPLADAGNAQAAYYVARMLSAGRGVARNPNEAVEIFKAAADKGHIGAQFELGKSLADGEGVEKDDFYAYVWLAIAAEGGSPEASELLDSIASRLQPVQIEQADEFAASKRHQIEQGN